MVGWVVCCVQVLIRLVETADKLNQAQAQLEYRKALKRQAKRYGTA